MIRAALSFVIFLAVVVLAAMSGAQFTPGAWYASLAKPPWTPPGWLFAPVWSLIYLMIATAGWLIWRSAAASGEQAAARTAALVAWGTQMVFNGAWSWLMFGRHQISLALIDIVLLWLTIAAFTWLAWRVSRPAALLFLPYLAWISFASALNFAVWRLNP